MNEQEHLRYLVKRCKWECGISYKEIAKEVVGMNYNAFMNFVNGHKDLGHAKRVKLKEFITARLLLDLENIKE